MTFEIVNDLTPPSISTRIRAKGEFGTTLDSLEVGQGFRFRDKQELKKLYPRVAPKKFGGKRFKIWEIEPATDTEMALFGVVRIAPTADGTPQAA